MLDASAWSSLPCLTTLETNAYFSARLVSISEVSSAWFALPVQPFDAARVSAEAGERGVQEPVPAEARGRGREGSSSSAGDDDAAVWHAQGARPQRKSQHEETVPGACADNQSLVLLNLL